jgi:ribonuclease HI
MNITINTDASYCHHTGAGGFACWIVCDIGRLKYSGVLKNANSAIDAELMAIANAVYLLSKSKFNNGKIDNIFINTDCKPAIEKIGCKKDHKIGRYIAKRLKKIYRENQANKISNNPRTKIKHVKAHTNNTDSRSWVNNWCDVEAKTQMKIERRQRQCHT